MNRFGASPQAKRNLPCRPLIVACASISHLCTRTLYCAGLYASQRPPCSYRNNVLQEGPTTIVISPCCSLNIVSRSPRYISLMGLGVCEHGLSTNAVFLTKRHLQSPCRHQAPCLAVIHIEYPLVPSPESAGLCGCLKLRRARPVTKLFSHPPNLFLCAIAICVADC
jgi:hypothetical protein